MGPKKGSGPSKGKAPAKKRPAPQVSPQPSSSDEESWPIWQELQGKILALEAQKSGQKVPTPSVVPRKSARESKGKRKAKLAALAQELMQRCDALESLQVTAGDEQEAEEGPSAANTVAPRPRRGKAAAPELISPEVELQTESFLSEGPSATTSHPGDAPSTSGSASDRALQGACPRGQRSARGSSRGGLGDWREEASKAIGMALAPRTRKGYFAASVEFQEFRQTMQLEQAWPIPVEHLQQFIVSLYRRGLAPGTIQGRLSALAFVAKVNGFTDFSGDFRIKKMLEGWSRERGQVYDSRTPMSPSILQQLGEQWIKLCKDQYESALFKAATLVAFFGALRVSELVAMGRADTSCMALQLKDVLLQDGLLRIMVRRSKVDQSGKGKQLVLGKCSIRSICPVKAVQEFLEIRGQLPGYLFSHSDGSPLTKYQFWKVTDMALERVGVTGMKFGTHSFRIGAASTAAALGYSTDQIKQLGRWASSSYRRYIRPLPNV
ncbi:integrase/recombinase xerD homolog isoform X1 [Pogona vitticeps]